MALHAYSMPGAPLRTPNPGAVARPFAPVPHLRPWLESRVEQLLDEADRLLALLDALDGDADLEADADAEPSLAGFNQVGCPGDDRELDLQDLERFA